MQIAEINVATPTANRKNARSKPRLAFQLANGWGIKGFLHSAILAALADDFELAAWVQPSAVEPWRDLMRRGQSPEVTLFPTPPGSERTAERLLRQAQSSLFFVRNRIETEAIKNKGTRRKRWQRITRSIIAGPAQSPLGGVALKGLQSLRQITGARPDFRAHFDAFKPDMVILGHPVDIYEVRVAYEARQRGIPVVGSVLSWDNLTSKGMIPDWFSDVLVWNETMRDEVLRFYPAYRPEQIHIVGVPRFDVYQLPLPPQFQREPFLKSLGLDPKKRLLFHANSASLLFPEQPQIIRHLEEAIRSGELPNCQLLVRRHPRDDFDLKDSEHVKVWRQKVQNADVINWFPDPEDSWILAAMLRHAEVNINPASTITLESAICDVPIINVAYDGDEVKPYEKSVRRFYDYSHQTPMLKYGATVLARSREELMAQVKEYLNKPELHRAQRSNLANSFCSVAAGSAVERSAAAIRSSAARHLKSQ
jgi:hypothetical protein